ncbi:TUDOR domain containing protein [Trichuris trichiura]|uniref:TUDOR domain containing protein n=1 Tax=Trichuris trichiura TaxID=36087 RepID=A0A077Z5V4_TRITR|nr:TUDOR domain containing protein [Trichuris trichiura]
MDQITFYVNQLGNEENRTCLRMKQRLLLEPITSLTRNLETLLGKEIIESCNEFRRAESVEIQSLPSERVLADIVSEEDEKAPTDEDQWEVPSEALDTIERSDKFLADYPDEQQLQCRVLEVYSPSIFLVTFIPTTKPVVKSMQGGKKFEPERKPRVGGHCFAQLSTDNLERVKILSLKDNKKGIRFAKVLRIDDGKVEWVPVKLLLRLPLDYYFYPRSTLHCCLSGIAPKSDDWSEKTIDWLKKFCSVDGSTYHISVEGNRICDTDIVPVHLYKTDKDSDNKDIASSGLLKYVSEEVTESVEDDVYGLTGPVEELTSERSLASLPPDFFEASKSECSQLLMSAMCSQKPVVQVTVCQDYLSNGMKREMKFTVYKNVGIARAESLNRFYAIVLNNNDHRSPSTAEDAVYRRNNKMLKHSEAPKNSIMFGLHGLHVRPEYAFNDSIYSIVMAKFIQSFTKCDRLSAVCTAERSNTGSNLVVLFGWQCESAASICLNEELSKCKEIDAKDYEAIKVWRLAKDVLKKLDERQSAAELIVTEGM